MGFPSIPDGIRSIVSSKFIQAKHTGALIYYPTEVELLNVNGLEFQLRFSQALAHKPAKAKGSDQLNKPYDPFEDPPPQLFLANIAASHKLVLNKFAIVPEHFILATVKFEEQDHLLDINDIGSTYALIRGWQRDGGELFAFFNGGKHSGASQRHRHVQFLPVDAMRGGLNGHWTPMLDSFVNRTNDLLPFMTFAENISIDSTPQQLYTLYLELYKRACKYTGIVSPDVQPGVSSAISYNLGMSGKTMCICPRKSEGARIKIGNDSGFVALNGTLLAGTVLVKNSLEWNTLRHDKTQLTTVLETVAYSSTTYDNNKL